LLIFESSTSNFSELVINNKISDIMRSNYKSYYGRDVGNAEYNSWQNSTQFVNNLIQHAELKDNHILLEYELPYNQSRLDCILFGKDVHTNPKLILIELKQWSSVEPSNNQGNVVETYTGGAVREVAHPSEQVKGYHDYLVDFVEYLQDEEKLFSCVYCHNYTRSSDSFLYDKKFQSLLDDHPIFSKDDVSSLSKILKESISYGSGLEVFNRFMQSNIRPSKKLLKSVSKMIEGEKVFSLLNEQIVAKNTIISELRKNYKSENKSVIIIQGGPGTGKSVIALHILSYLADKDINILWACKSKSFREGIMSLIKPRARTLFKNLYKVINPNIIKQNNFDAILVDEAHRIEKKGDTMYTPKSIRSDMSMIDRIIRSAKTSIFFIDDDQLIRGNEIGSTSLIKESAVKFDAMAQKVILIG